MAPKIMARNDANFIAVYYRRVAHGASRFRSNGDGGILMGRRDQ
jgi:hypothetical protein